MASVIVAETSGIQTEHPRHSNPKTSRNMNDGRESLHNTKNSFVIRENGEAGQCVQSWLYGVHGFGTDLMRRRVNYEKCRAIYDEDMDRKIQFILRKNRVDPFPGCS